MCTARVTVYLPTIPTMVHHERVHTVASDLPSIPELLTEYAGVVLREGDDFEWDAERVGIFRVRLRYAVTIRRYAGDVEVVVFDVPVA